MNIVTTKVSLTVEDIAASSRFFTAYLGFREVESTEGYICLRRDDSTAEIALCERDPELPPRAWRGQGLADLAVTLTVTDLTAEYERLRGRGSVVVGPIRQEPWGERQFLLTDPNGVVVRLAEWVPPAGAPEHDGSAAAEEAGRPQGQFASDAGA
ncbi:VOC family protein [Streptomyces sp. NPDC048337]|uniref:VOC family protein n=1 Tax=Streptomyces sp. NPDC048337 TaxID=3365535 RepID=UPI0037191F5B